MGRRAGRKITRRIKAEHNQAGLREVMAHPEQIHRVLSGWETDGSPVLKVQLFCDLEGIKAPVR
jgi:hypothetical protein